MTRHFLPSHFLSFILTLLSLVLNTYFVVLYHSLVFLFITGVLFVFMYVLV